MVSSELKALLQVLAKCAVIAAFAMAPFLSAAQQSVPKPTTVLIHPAKCCVTSKGLATLSCSITSALTPTRRHN